MKNISINLELQAQQVWKTTDVDEKKRIIREMIDLFRFKHRQEHFRKIVNSEDRSARLDKLASDIMLADTDKVVKL